MDRENCVSFTDFVRNCGEPSFMIKNWIRTIDTIEYMGLWEQLENDHFNLGEFAQIKSKADTYYFYLLHPMDKKFKGVWYHRMYDSFVQPSYIFTPYFLLLLSKRTNFLMT